MIREPKAVWRGTGRADSLISCSVALAEAQFSFRTRFENEQGTYPEELIVAARAGCSTVALAFQLRSAGSAPTAISPETTVALGQERRGFRIGRSAPTLQANAPNLDEVAFARAARDAKKSCLVSKVLSAAIKLDGELFRVVAWASTQHVKSRRKRNGSNSSAKPGRF